MLDIDKQHELVDPIFTKIIKYIHRNEDVLTLGILSKKSWIICWGGWTTKEGMESNNSLAKMISVNKYKQIC